MSDESPPADPLSDLERQLSCAMVADRHGLRRLADRIRDARRAGKPHDRNLKKFTDRLAASAERFAARKKTVPQINYPADLPVSERIDDLAAAITDHQVVIVCGETGSGKSTQLPKLCLQLGRGIAGAIGHTQPRRIAARSVASRIAEELGVGVGREVGFKVRFADATTSGTLVKLMTDGILLAESQGDRFFNGYDTIIIDEAHERSLNIDFLLGLIKRLLPKRPDLKLIITSATIDAERFSDHFRNDDGPAPVVEVSGRTYPVELRYRPLAEDDSDNERTPERAICDAVAELATTREPSGVATGDVLVFLPTERDIRETARVLRGFSIPGDPPNRKTEILPLYGRLSVKDQQRVFQPSGHRRIVLATNVAESSLTVPGIRSVIDTGTARISRYSAHSKVQRLPIEPVSQASADQRKGRCGRIGPGVCIRLYAEEDFDSRSDFTAPEIQRTNLASVILQTMHLRLGSLEEFPFLEPPKPIAIRDGYRTLFELGAIDERQQLTPLGRKLAPMPVDPRIGRIILAADEENCLREMLIIASALEVQDPRERPIDKQQAADAAHAQFVDPNSDFLGYLKIWDWYAKKKADLSRNKLRKACGQNFLSANRMREWFDVHRQLRQLVDDAGYVIRDRQDDSDAIHRALLTGLLANIAQRTDQYEYTGAGGKKLHLWPGAGCFDSRPKWIVAAELVETTRRYARTVASVDPRWIEPLAGHLLKRSYSDPFWSSKSGAAMVHERVTLFGLPVIENRRVKYGRLNRELARELFIRHALVEGDWNETAPFMTHNDKLLREVTELAERSRRMDLLRDEEERFAFFDARLGEDVTDPHRLRKWRKIAERDNPKVLFLSEDDLLHEETQTLDPERFPPSIRSGSLELPLEYNFDPGSEEDGVSIRVPLEAVNQLDPSRLEWLVPGLLEEKVTALLRSLPKSIRRNFVPAPQTAREVAAKLTFGQGRLLDAVADRLSRLGNTPVAASDFDPSRLAPHLRMTVRVLGNDGDELTASRNLTRLRQELAATASEHFAAVSETEWNRDGLTDWDFDELPEAIEVQRQGILVRGYPAIIDGGLDVSLRLFDSRERADAETRSGLRRLFLLTHRKNVESQVNWLPNVEQMKLLSMTMGGFNAFREQASELLVDRAMWGSKPAIPRTKTNFDKLVKSTRGQLGAAASDLTRILMPVLEGLHRIRQVLDNQFPPAWQTAVDDMRSQLKELTRGRFLVETPFEWLHQFPRYFDGIRVRLDRLKNGGLDKDRTRQEQIRPLWKGYLDHRSQLNALGLADPRFEYYRWMLEEFRVSLFAQSLGTAVPVSEERLARQWEKVATIEAAVR